MGGCKCNERQYSGALVVWDGQPLRAVATSSNRSELPGRGGFGMAQGC